MIQGESEMLTEALKQVCAAEENARQERLLAQQKAQESVDIVEKAGKETIAATLARAESEIAHMIRLSDQKATQEAAELASTTANRLATQRARAERRLDSAAQLIVERIVKSGGRR